jgi:hypothetical protein
MSTFALVAALNLVAMAWNFRAIDKLGQNSVLLRHLSAKFAGKHVDNGNAFRVLILISSIP